MDKKQVLAIMKSLNPQRKMELRLVTDKVIDLIGNECKSLPERAYIVEILRESFH